MDQAQLEPSGCAERDAETRAAEDTRSVKQDVETRAAEKTQSAERGAPSEMQKLGP